MKRFIVLLLFSLSVISAYSQAPTREQLQLLQATGYNNKSGAYRIVLYLPPDTLSNAQHGSIAAINNVLYFKDSTAWRTILTTETAGKINAAANVGDGVGIFKQKVDTTLEFFTLVGGTNMQVVRTSGSDTIIIQPTFGPADGSETKIVQGANILITGNGTTATPYELFVPFFVDNVTISNDTLYKWVNETRIFVGTFGGSGSSTWGSITGTLSDQTDLQAALDLKLNITDTTNKWVSSLRRRPGTDTVEMHKNGTWQFAFIDSTGTDFTLFNALGGTGDSLINSDQEVKWLNTGFGLARSATGTTVTHRADTTRSTGLPTYHYTDSVVAAAGGGSTSLTSTQIAYGSGTNTVTSEAAFNYNATNNAVNVDSINARLLSIRADTLKAIVIDIRTLQGDTAITAPYGNFSHTLSQSYIELDGQRDAVYQWGYNHNGVGGKRNTNEAEFHYALESHYGFTNPQFEIIWQSLAKDNTLTRHFGMNINKNVGNSLAYWRTASMDWYADANEDTAYFFANAAGMAGTTGLTPRFSITNKTITSGQMLINSESDGSMTISNGSTGSANTFNFMNSIIQQSGKAEMYQFLVNNNNANAIYISGSTTQSGGYPSLISSIVSASGGTIFRNQNTHATGAAVNITEADGTGSAQDLYIGGASNTNITAGLFTADAAYKIQEGNYPGSVNLLTAKLDQHMGVSGITSPTARLHLPIGSTPANSAPLKFELTSAALMTAAEAGALEAVSEFLYYTNSTATRDTLLTWREARINFGGGGADGNGLYGGNGGAGGDGSLPGATTITGAGNTLTLTGTQSSNSAFNVTNTGNGGAGAFSTTGTGSALTGSNSSSGNGVLATSSSGNGIRATSTTGLSGLFKVTPSSTNTVVNVIDLIAGTSGTAAAGRGGALNFKITDDAGNDVNGVTLQAVFTSAATGSTSTGFHIKTTNAGSATTKFILSAAGQLNLATYGSGTYTGTAAYFLASTSGGDVIEKTPTQVGQAVAPYTDATIITADASDFTISAGITYCILPDLTGAATSNITLPTSPRTGQEITIKNKNSHATNKWHFDPDVFDATDTSVDFVPDDAVIILTYVGSSTWNIKVIYQ